LKTIRTFAKMVIENFSKFFYTTTQRCECKK